MKKGKSSLSFQLPMIFALMLTLALFASPAISGQTVLKAAYYAADDHPIAKLGKESLAQIEKLTEGRVKVVLYPNSTLVPTTEMAAAVDEGTAFCANWYMPYMSKTIPLFDLETLSVWTKGYDAVLAAYENGINDLYSEALFRQGLKNTKVGGVSMCLWRVLGMNKKVAKVPDDIKGMKIRSVGAEADMFKAMGASPVNITSPQTYEALSRGIAEGATNALQIMSDRRWLEYIKHVTNINLSPVLMHIIYNTNELKKLDPKDQPVVEKAMRDLADHTMKGLLTFDEATKAKATNEFGVKFYDLTPQEKELWMKAAAPITEKFEAIKDPFIEKAMGIVRKFNP
jgi:TRAP-type C4-dicarboxylate transport system substrate-binding protein